MKKREWIIVAVLLAACIAAAFFLYRPKEAAGGVVAVIHDIHHQAGLMFAGAGNNGGFGGFRFHRFPGIPCFIRTSTRLLKRDSCFCCVR